MNVWRFFYSDNSCSQEATCNGLFQKLMVPLKEDMRYQKFTYRLVWEFPTKKKTNKQTNIFVIAGRVFTHFCLVFGNFQNNKRHFSCLFFFWVHWEFQFFKAHFCFPNFFRCSLKPENFHIFKPKRHVFFSCLGGVINFWNSSMYILTRIE